MPIIRIHQGNDILGIGPEERKRNNMFDLHRVMTIDELESELHFDNLLEDLDFVMLYGLRDR